MDCMWTCCGCHKLLTASAQFNRPGSMTKCHFRCAAHLVGHEAAVQLRGWPAEAGLTQRQHLVLKAFCEQMHVTWHAAYYRYTCAPQLPAWAHLQFTTTILGKGEYCPAGYGYISHSYT